MGITPQGISVLVTYDCNAACPHCFFRCQKDSPTLPPDMLADALASLRQPLRWLHFTGGEVLLVPDALWSLLEAARAHHRYDIGIATNGWWGQSPRRATAIVQRLQQAGVNGVCLSADHFHQLTIPVEDLTNAARAVVKSGLTRHSWLVCSLLDDDYADAERLNEKSRAIATEVATASGLTVAEISVRPLGRSARLSRQDDLPAALPSGPCQDMACCLGDTTTTDPQMVWIDPMGNVMICHGLTIGSLHEASLQEILDSYAPQQDPVLNALDRDGPQGIYHLAQTHAVAPSGPFLDRCDLCFKSRRALQEVYPRTLTPAVCYPASLR